MTEREKELCTKYPDEISNLMNYLDYEDENGKFFLELANAAVSYRKTLYHAKEPEVGAKIFIPKNLSRQVHDERLDEKTYILRRRVPNDHLKEEEQDWEASSDDNHTWIEIGSDLTRDLYNGLPILNIAYVYSHGERQVIDC